MISSCSICSKSASLVHIESMFKVLILGRRNFSISKIRNRKITLPKLTSDNVNMQKKLQIKYSADFIQNKIKEYDLGTRRLARIMGQNPDTFTEEDVNNAISYLFPTGLFSSRSQPRMDHPEKVYPLLQEVKTDKDGRPQHHLYYTQNPEIFAVMSETYKKVLEAQNLYDKNIWKNTEPETLNLETSKWKNMDEIASILEVTNPLTEPLYNQFIAQLERLLEEPYATDFKDYIMQYRNEIPPQTIQKEEVKIEIDESGRKFSRASGKRKTAFAWAKLYSEGSGQITVNEKSMQEFFMMLQDRQCVIAPFVFLGMIRCFDVEVKVDGGFTGTWTMLNGSYDENDARPKSAMAGAIRLAISNALLAFVNEEQAEQMRRAGLLTYDIRIRERKKPGLKGARRAPTWKKR